MFAGQCGGPKTRLHGAGDGGENGGGWHEVETRFPAWRDERAWFHAEGRRLKARLRGLLAED